MAEELELTITNFQRCHVQGIFYRQNVGFLSLHSSMMTPWFPLSGPYAAITYRLGIVKRLSDEIWSCDMTPRADGFIVVSLRGTFKPSLICSGYFQLTHSF